jgi:hypothetical protein
MNAALGHQRRATGIALWRQTVAGSYLPATAASRATQRSMNNGWHLRRQEALVQGTGTSLKLAATFSVATS